MEIKKFLKLLHNNNAIRLNEEYILFNDLELYSFKTMQETHFKSIEEFLNYEFQDSTMKAFIIRTEEFYNKYDGGRGSTSSAMGGGFNHARSGGGKDDLRNMKYPAEFNVGGKNRSYEKTLALFKQKYGNADHEYGVTVDDMGFVHKHIEGGATSVSISGNKGQMILHNHPGGGNFSDSDLISVASTNERGIVAVGANKTYTFKKTKRFNSKGFIKAVKNAKWPAKYNYDKGADWWLKRNAKNYGYTYSAG